MVGRVGQVGLSDLVQGGRTVAPPLGATESDRPWTSLHSAKGSDLGTEWVAKGKVMNGKREDPRAPRPLGLKIRTGHDRVVRLIDTESGRWLASIRWRPCGTLYLDLPQSVRKEITLEGDVHGVDEPKTSRIGTSDENDYSNRAACRGT